jgi:hypothetical protein
MASGCANVNDFCLDAILAKDTSPKPRQNPSGEGGEPEAIAFPFFIILRGAHEQKKGSAFL